MNSRYILELVQDAFNNHNIKEKTKTEDLVFIRYVYFQLCREFTKESLASIGGNVERDHTTVLNGYKRFEELIFHTVYEPFIPYYKVYNYLRKGLISMKIDYDHLQAPKTAYEIQLEEKIKEEYSKQLFREIDKNNRLMETFKHVVDCEALKKIAELPREDVEEFERMADVFYKRKISEKQYA